jgi:hypothetical protein
MVLSQLIYLLIIVLIVVAIFSAPGMRFNQNGNWGIPGGIIGLVVLLIILRIFGLI